MTTLFWIIAAGFLLNIFGGLAAIVLRRGAVDALMAALLIGTTGVALVLVLGKAQLLERAADIALVFALLAAVLGVAFVRSGSDSWKGGAAS
jgi:multicomponent Na+:H+ antiporter subunit F